MESHILLSTSSDVVSQLAQIELEPLNYVLNVEKPEIRKKRRSTPSIGADGLETPVDGSIPTANGQIAADPAISKAASRMRQYRADHKNDKVWLKKEAERMRRMRAVRKGTSLEQLATEIAVDEFGIPLPKPVKEKKDPAVRKKRERKGTVLRATPDAVIEASFEAIISSPTGEIAAAKLVEKNLKREEFRRKEANRIRRYRALKRQDQVWKDKDAERMRLYRAKRKGDYVKSVGKDANSTYTPLECDLPEGGGRNMVEYDTHVLLGMSSSTSSSSSSAAAEATAVSSDEPIMELSSTSVALEGVPSSIDEGETMVITEIGPDSDYPLVSSALLHGGEDDDSDSDSDTMVV